MRFPIYGISQLAGAWPEIASEEQVSKIFGFKADLILEFGTRLGILKES